MPTQTFKQFCSNLDGAINESPTLPTPRSNPNDYANRSFTEIGNKYAKAKTLLDQLFAGARGRYAWTRSNNSWMKTGELTRASDTLDTIIAHLEWVKHDRG